jgi:formiminoglutamase
MWTGRDDGPQQNLARWHSVVRPWAPSAAAGGAVVLIGFPSDEGVRRNHGRTGAAGGPGVLRRALASLADPGIPVFDAGDVPVDTDLEAGQERLGQVVAAALAAGALPLVIGGGHDLAYGSYLGWSAQPIASERWGILNLDAHFDLREERRSTSGTPFRQIARAEEETGRTLRYAVAGISRASNTRALFDTADALGVAWLSDEADDRETVTGFVTQWLEKVDRVHLSVDLDVLPGSVAPGVSAPAGFGLGVAAVRAAVREVVGSGKLGLLEVAELNPRFDVDDRTARIAARLVDEAVRGLRPAAR